MTNTKCVDLVPGVKFCVTKTDNTVSIELDFFGHSVFRATLTEDHPCIDAHVHILFASATFKACYDFGKNEATFTGKICVVGKCVDVDVTIHLPSGSWKEENPDLSIVHTRGAPEKND